MSSKVYFVNLRSRSDKNNKIIKIRRLFERAGFDNNIKGMVKKVEWEALSMNY
jgi:uncharacterized Fe-S center protein